MNEEEWRHVRDDVQLQDLWVFLNQQLGGNRYLLILNDFELVGLMNYEEWNDKWNQFKHILLRVGGPGSTVIMTGARFDFESEIFKLERISEKAWVELLLRHALMIQPDQDTKEAENYGRKLYGQVHTQPSLLDAKYVGSALKYIKVDQWEKYTFSVLVHNPHYQLMYVYCLPTRYAQYMLYWSLFDYDREILDSEDFMHMMTVEEGLGSHSSDKEERIGYIIECLRHVRLVNLKRCERLPPLGRLPNLDNVEISGMDLVEVVDDSFYGKHGRFFELLKITFSEMPKLEKWLSPTETQRYVLFPNLVKLTVIQCPKFKQLDVHLRHLRKLKLWMNNEMMFTSEFVGWHNLENAEYLEVIGCQELRCLPQSMHQELVQLERMNILSCHNLISLPLTDNIIKCIEDCPKL
ncbi:disease resistance protein RGA3 [Canna indica]|uniref:Disease resistance protein RGA3 n=1 Tax=Canna indica TaxID=4628 RepID=A0AAQ3L497_9LILI|nr:disease resistance protein RGA3 [Canna indica]